MCVIAKSNRLQRVNAVIHPLSTRRALSVYKAYGDSAYLVLNATLLNSVNALLALSQQHNALHNITCY